jgi:uncharacterized protein YcbK (DUF882 family)
VRSASLVCLLLAVSPSLHARARPTAELTALNTHEIFRLRPDERGRFGARELRGWNRFLRCHHTGRVHAMAHRLAELLYATARHFSEHKILVVAGYRAPSIARQKGNPKSPHKRGLACDFRVDGVSNEDLRDYLRGAFARVGVGYYPNSDFVHLDVGRKSSSYWIDYSGPGERAQYNAPEPEAEEAGPSAAPPGEAPYPTAAVPAAP